MLLAPNPGNIITPTAEVPHYFFRKKCLLYHSQCKDEACKLLSFQPGPPYFFRKKCSFFSEEIMMRSASLKNKWRQDCIGKLCQIFLKKLPGAPAPCLSNPGIIAASAKKPAPQHSFWKNSWSFQTEWSGWQAPVLNKPRIFIFSDKE